MIKVRPSTIMTRKDPRIYKVYTGRVFNEEYRNARFIKVLDKTLIHYNFIYNIGVNKDTNPFNHRPNFCNNGLYFFRIPLFAKDIPNNLKKYMFSYGSLVADVEIPDYANILVESSTEFKADHLILSNIRQICNLE